MPEQNVLNQSSLYDQVEEFYRRCDMKHSAHWKEQHLKLIKRKKKVTKNTHHAIYEELWQSLIDAASDYALSILKKNETAVAFVFEKTSKKREGLSILEKFKKSYEPGNDTLERTYYFEIIKKACYTYLDSKEYKFGSAQVDIDSLPDQILESDDTRNPDALLDASQINRYFLDIGKSHLKYEDRTLVNALRYHLISGTIGAANDLYDLKFRKGRNPLFIKPRDPLLARWELFATGV